MTYLDAKRKLTDMLLNYRRQHCAQSHALGADTSCTCIMCAQYNAILQVVGDDWVCEDCASPVYLSDLKD